MTIPTMADVVALLRELREACDGCGKCLHCESASAIKSLSIELSTLPPRDPTRRPVGFVYEGWQ